MTEKVSRNLAYHKEADLLIPEGAIHRPHLRFADTNPEGGDGRW
jgi:hypothetical protein